MITLKNMIDLQPKLPHNMILSGTQKNTKIMFHKIDKKRTDINPKFNIQAFEEFQKEHWNIFFASTEYIFSFWYEGKTARYIGCYKMNNPIKDTVNDNKGKSHTRYKFPNMCKIDFMNEYEDRLYIDWTNPTANYGRFVDEEKYYVHSIASSKDNSIGRLPSEYYEIQIDYSELNKLIDYQIDNQEWFNYLSTRSGIYIIYDKSTKEQYIGSAYGDTGFWGRWSAYAAKTDGNTGFKGKDYNNFQFSIIWETLISTTQKKILNVESEFKKSLGTRIHGLNNN